MQQSAWFCAGLNVQVCHLSCRSSLAADLLLGSIQRAATWFRTRSFEEPSCPRHIYPTTRAGRQGMLHVPSPKEAHLMGPRRAISIVAPFLWNIIPTEIRLAPL